MGSSLDIGKLYTEDDKIKSIFNLDINMNSLLANNSSSVSANNERRFSTLNNSAFTDDSVTVYVGTQVVEKIVPVA